MPSRDSRIYCPNCGVEMDYVIERERLGNGNRRVTVAYKCPVCNARIVDYQALIRFNGASGVVVLFNNGIKRVVIETRVGSVARRQKARTRGV